MWISLYVLFFLFAFVYNFIKHSYNASSYLLSIYLFSSIAGTILLFNYDTYDENLISFWPVLFHIVCLGLFIFPLTYFFNKISISQIIDLPIKFYKILTIITIGFCLVSIVYRLPLVIASFSSGDIVASRRLIYEGEGSKGAKNIFEYVGIFGNYFYPISMFLFFVNLVSKQKNKFLLVVLFVCSLAEVFQGLSMMGRGGLMRWGLLLVFMFLLFKPLLDKNVISHLRKWSLIVLGPILFVFYLISSARFSEREFGLGYSLVDYAGQSFIYFSYNFDKFFENSFGGRQVFPILFPSNETVPMTGINDIVYAPYNINTFPTFVGNFYIDMGFLTTLIISICFCIFCILFFTLSNKKNTIVKLSLYLIFTQIVMNGFLYFMFYSPTTIKSFLLVQITITLLYLITVRKISF